MTSPDDARTPKAPKSTERTAAEGTVLTNLPAAMTGRASPAKAAVGDKPVFAYISSLPQPQRSIAERVDALAATTLPAPQRCVKWGSWCARSTPSWSGSRTSTSRGDRAPSEPPVAAPRFDAPLPCGFGCGAGVSGAVGCGGTLG